jgi:flagellar assembly protein FliH
MSEPVHQRFGFDTVFDGQGEVTQAAPRPKRLYTAEEVEAVREQARGEGEMQALASMKAMQAQALAAISETTRQALSTLVGVAHAHRVGSAELALACGKAIADAALERFPQAPLQAAIAVLAREIEAAPRLVVNAPADLVKTLEPILAESAQAIGYSGQILVRAAPDQIGCAFTLDFGDGAATFDPVAASARVSAALHEALAAEGLHAEPLIAGTEG